MKTPTATAKHPSNIKKAHVNTMSVILGCNGDSEFLTDASQPSSVKIVIMGVCVEGNPCWVR